MLFVSNDNLRKGAALNAVQIAEVIAAGAATCRQARLTCRQAGWPAVGRG